MTSKIWMKCSATRPLIEVVDNLISILLHENNVGTCHQIVALIRTLDPTRDQYHLDHTMTEPSTITIVHLKHVP